MRTASDLRDPAINRLMTVQYRLIPHPSSPIVSAKLHRERMYLITGTERQAATLGHCSYSAKSFTFR